MDVTAYWLFSNGSRCVTSDGAAIIFDKQPQPIPPVLDDILGVRSLIDDPHFAAGQGIIYASPRPYSLITGAITTDGNGRYYRYGHKRYHLMYPVLSDFTISSLPGKNVYQKAVAAIQRLIAMLNPSTYTTSFSTGGQSTSFPSFAEVMQYYKDLELSLSKLYSKGKISWANPKSLPVGGEGW
ncbi:MAG: hypothetical protein LBJ41_01850 [Treponema sp.]|jgi:hypothetical protein|nr:hypothetical protein [Treponema sp.]